MTTESKESKSIGVSETSATYNKARALIGKQDDNGNTIGIVYIKSFFKDSGLIIRVAILFLVIASLLISKPLAWLPNFDNAPEINQSIVHYELFSVFTWFLLFLSYLAYFIIAHVKNNLFQGLPGATIFFTKYKKIVDQLPQGQVRKIIDPRVRDFAIVSQKPIVLNMPQVEGETKDQITVRHKGFLIMEVQDPYKLLVQGGYQKFLEQLTSKHVSCIKDLMIKIDASGFSKFLVDDIPVAEGSSGENDGAKKDKTIGDRLQNLSSEALSVELLSSLSEIDEVDISKISLNESENPDRLVVKNQLANLGLSYGIVIKDYIPVANSISEEYLKTQVKVLISFVIRLKQATTTLREINEEEIQEEITANVADKKNRCT